MPTKTSSPFTQMSLPALNTRLAQPIEIDYKMPELKTVKSSAPKKSLGSFTSAESDALSMGLGAASSFVGPKGIEDPNFSGKYAQQKALEFGAKGMQFGGPVGAFFGAVGGLGYGLIKGQDIKADYLMGQQDKLIADEKKQEDKQKYEMMEEYNSPVTMSGKPIKALTQMQGTLAHNMSAAQYNKALQMKEISGAATMMTTNEAKMVKALESDDIPENDVVAEKIKNK